MPSASQGPSLRSIGEVHAAAIPVTAKNTKTLISFFILCLL